MPSLSPVPKPSPSKANTRLKRQAPEPARPRTRWAARLRTSGRVVAAAIRWTRSLSGLSFTSGVVAGLFVLVFCHGLSARFGAGLPFVAGAFAAVTLGLFAGAASLRGWRSQSRLGTILPCLLVAVWAIGFAQLGDLAALVCRSISLESLASPLVQYAVACGVSLVLLGVPAACAARLGFAARSLQVGWLLSGLACGLFAAANLIAPWLGVSWTAWIATACGTAILVALPWAKSRQAEIVGPARLAPAAWITAVLTTLAAAAGAAALCRLALQLFPSAEAEGWSAWAGFALGAAFGWFVCRPGQSDPRRRAVVRLLLAGGLALALPALLFGLLIHCSLAVTASISQAALLIVIRSVASAALLLPLGAAWGAAVAASAPESAAGKNGLPSQNPFAAGLFLRLLPALGAGYLAACWLLARGASVPVITAGGAILMAGLAARLSFVAASRGERRRIANISAAVAVPAMVAAAGAISLLAGTYSPARAARLLFSTDVFVERNAGTETRLLPFLDDGRLVECREGDRGTFTLWKHHGVQLELRENGIPLGTYCGRSEICPQYSSQVLTALLPLALHEAPRRVLLLGLGSGSTLLTSLEFPVAEVTCVEGDRALVDLLDRTVWPSSPANPRGDNRVRLVELDPVAAVQSRSGGYDVILCDTDPAGIATGTPYFTREFYSSASAQLAADGIFAQRFRSVDFGPWPVRSVLSTLKAAFTQAAAVDAGGGDLVLLATNSPRGLSRPDLLKRFEAAQVGRTLAQAGWDWSVALNLSAYAGKGLDQLIEKAPVNSARNGLFAFRLPTETVRWGAKREELAEALTPCAGRIAEWPNADGNDPELLRRLSDVIHQRELMTTYPDQPWAYRKAVHEQLTKHPHTVIADDGDGYDRRLHPVDEHRLNYLAALGGAAKLRRPSLECLRQLEEFAEPYDPILTYFVHHELAALYARAGTPDPAAQLRHRLYTVYYGDVRDRSIRDVVEALRLLALDPQIGTAVERFDHMNALLQFLKLRWNNRGLGKPSSVRIALNDLEKSIGAAEGAFSTMETLRAEAGVSATDWQARREVLERSLVRPLRTYQSQLLPEYLKEIQPPPLAKTPAPSPRQNAN